MKKKLIKKKGLLLENILSIKNITESFNDNF